MGKGHTTTRGTPAMYSKKGKLTAYALACGYVEFSNKVRPEPYHAIALQLYMEHGAYHVRAHDHGAHTRLAWETFLTLREARARFKALDHDLSQSFTIS